MFKIRHIAVDHFKVPLPLALSDSTHGEITHFGLVTVRLTDAQGREGLGYTYTVNNIGAAAVSTLIEQDLSPGIIIFLLNFSIFLFIETENFFFIF